MPVNPLARHRVAVVRSRGSRARRTRTILSLAAAALSFGLVAISAVAPATMVSASQRIQAERDAVAQKFTVSDAVIVADVSRATYSVTPGVDTWVRGGTNHDWARLVLLLGGWPVSDNNVTVLTRWMRQENGADNWWNRNNPLNNGWGSGGGGGTGSYPNLVVAAENAAKALHGLPGYRPIIDALAASAPTEVTEHAIWASPWASGHYANGGHWHYTPVDTVKAPPGAW